LAAHPEIAFAAATTGPSNLIGSVVCADQRELYGYMTTRIAALPGVTPGRDRSGDPDCQAGRQPHLGSMSKSVAVRGASVIDKWRGLR
jgi:hypothetical protein